eukprot:CAMPEP_0176415622 /NCGR_PEP_ID=MMETSP0127-20121128/5906_1 /TAXON_ID=938130 /ORGANISM="Platyophrya macrostoma, Strain WH" /LENGTH=426 /DNA_ID=CAMNT_0017795633 /DNA_START=71 /DNA_END=1351 /DNA_ORIENTATION=-
MDEPDPSSYFLGPRGTGALTDWKAAAFRSYSQLNAASMPTDFFHFLIKLDEAYKYQLSLRKPRQKRTLPPVPSFESTETEPTIEKKRKDANPDETPINALAYSQVLRAATTHPPKLMDLEPTQPAQSIVCKVELVEEEKPNQVYLGDNLASILSQSGRIVPKEEEKEHLFDDCSTVDSPISQHYEDVSEKPSAKYSDHSGSFASDMSESPLDKKDLKKFKKFESCLREYLQKLNISDLSVERKYLQLLRLVVPQLSTHFKSKPFEAIAAAILLYACREVQYPITIKQITHVTEAKEKLVNKCIFSIKEIIPNNQEIKHFKADEFILVIGEKLQVSDVIKQAALKINENIERLGYMKSNHPATLACCCLKFAIALSGEDKGFDEIVEKAGINKMTLRNMYRDLFPYRFYFITSDCHLIKSPADLPNI